MTGGETYVGPLENGTKVGSLDFDTPLPGQWEPDQMDMKRHFAIHVAL